MQESLAGSVCMPCIKVGRDDRKNVWWSGQKEGVNVVISKRFNNLYQCKCRPKQIAGCQTHRREEVRHGGGRHDREKQDRKHPSFDVC